MSKEQEFSEMTKLDIILGLMSGLSPEEAIDRALKKEKERDEAEKKAPSQKKIDKWADEILDM